MKIKTSVLTAAMAAFTLIPMHARSADKPGQPVVAREFTFKKSQQTKVNYLLYLPKGYEQTAAKSWPLMLFLHGAGERGNEIWKVAVHGPPKHATNGVHLPFILVAPQCPEGQQWSNEILLGLLDEVCAKYKVDQTRLYLTGLSMGGYGTWNLGLSYPAKFAAIAPICGGGEMITVLLSGTDKQQAIKSLGVWAFHGAKDNVVPLSESERMVEALKRAGHPSVKLTVYPEANHDSWTETYKNPELYQWFLGHQRKP
jgi:predicted peptidase